MVWRHLPCQQLSALCYFSGLICNTLHICRWYIPVNIVVGAVSGSLIGFVVASIIRPPYPYFKFTIIHIGIGTAFLFHDFFSFLIVISIQHQDMPLFSMQEILEIYLWFLLQHYAGIRLIRLATLINATKMEMHISHLVNGYVLFYLFLSHPCSCFSQNN
jgi:hypothetical protein